MSSTAPEIMGEYEPRVVLSHWCEASCFVQDISGTTSTAPVIMRGHVPSVPLSHWCETVCFVQEIPGSSSSTADSNDAVTINAITTNFTAVLKLT
jgi:hypothetical protein